MAREDQDEKKCRNAYTIFVARLALGCMDCQSSSIDQIPFLSDPPHYDILVAESGSGYYQVQHNDKF